MSKDALPHATGDIETDPFKLGRYPKAFLGGFFDGKVSEIFDEYDGKNPMRDLIARCVKFPGLIYLHNGGKFDLHFFLTYILEHFNHDDLKPTCIGPRLVVLKTPTCEFRDSFSLIPKALKHITAAEKKELAIWKLEKDASDLTPEEAKTLWADATAGDVTSRPVWPSPREFYRKEIVSYLRQDCVGLHRAVGDFFNLYGRHLTLPGAAFSTLRKQFKMPVVHTRRKYDDLFRPFYYAGRVQFWELGKLEGNYKILDINSAFPAAMLDEHWFSSGYTVTDCPPETNPERSFYEITCDSLGALPVRTDKGIGFPSIINGSFFATGWELFAGIRCGLVGNVKYIRVYTPKGVRSFRDYVQHFYELKKNAPNIGERDFAKLFLTAAYGKFSQNSRDFSEVKITPYRDPAPKEMAAKGWYLSYDDEQRGLSFYQKPTYQEDGRDARGRHIQFYNVCTAASITGWVRAFLMRSMHECEGVVYCDTDSVIFRDAASLKISPELGDWKLEMECSEIHIGGKKLYAAKNIDQSDPKKAWKKASKGVRLSVEQIVKLCAGEKQTHASIVPNYSVFSPSRFVTRTVRRDDQRKKTA